MKLFLLIGACLALTNARVLKPNTSVNIRSKRMAGGVRTTIEKHPYLVSIEQSDAYICSGVIISEYYVLTAAHCITAPLDAIYKIRSGSSQTETGGNLHDVDEKIFHYKYAWRSQFYAIFNITIVRVKQPFVYGKTRKPIELSTAIASNTCRINKKLTFVSWGDPFYLNSSNYVTEIQLPWINKKACNRRYNESGGISKEQICTKGYKNVCFGDSGAALIRKGKLIGIFQQTASFWCGDYHFPPVYTEVAYVYDWIKMIVKHLNNSCK